jgi:predicted ATPase
VTFHTSPVASRAAERAVRGRIHGAPSALDTFGGSPVVFERARAVNRAVGIDSRSALAIADICRRAAGIPPAIELAAAWANVLPIVAIADRLSSGAGFARKPK